MRRDEEVAGGGSSLEQAGSLRLHRKQARLRRRRRLSCLGARCFVRAANKHAKHALQARDDKTNAATHQAAAAWRGRTAFVAVRSD